MENYLMEQLVVPLISSLLMAGLAYLVAWATGFTANIKDKRLAYHLNQAVEVVEQTVIAMNQRVVDDLKEGNVFDKKKQREVFEAAVDLAKSKMSDGTKKAVIEAHNDFQVWLEDEVDAQVKKAKANKEKTLEEYKKVRP